MLDYCRETISIPIKIRRHTQLAPLQKTKMSIFPMVLILTIRIRKSALDLFALAARFGYGANESRKTG